MRSTLALTALTVLGGCFEVGGPITESSPCTGSRTDAMWFDDASTGFVGCGSAAEGQGLFTTPDGGMSWSEVAGFEAMRVSSLSRAAGGELEVAGTGEGDERVVALAADGSLSDIWRKPSDRPQTWQTFHVGTFRSDASGRRVSESLTGSDVMYWSAADAEPVDGYGWWEGVVDGGAQILDLEVSAGRFLGVGSTINQPPYFFYEPEGGMGEAFALEAVDLSAGVFDGEVWDLAVASDGGLLAAGVDQQRDVAVLWHTGGAFEQASDWSFVSLVDLEAEAPASRFYGACREGDLLVAVGDYSQLGDPLIVASTDGGASFRTVDAPEGAGPLSRCQIVAGDVYLVGAEGHFSILPGSRL